MRAPAVFSRLGVGAETARVLGALPWPMSAACPKPGEHAVHVHQANAIRRLCASTSGHMFLPPTRVSWRFLGRCRESAKGKPNWEGRHKSDRLRCWIFCRQEASATQASRGDRLEDQPAFWSQLAGPLDHTHKSWRKLSIGAGSSCGRPMVGYVDRSAIARAGA